MVDYATLQVHKGTKERLANYRRPGESFDAVVQRMMDEAIKAEESEFLAELDALYDDDTGFEPLA